MAPAPKSSLALARHNKSISDDTNHSIKAANKASSSVNPQSLVAQKVASLVAQLPPTAPATSSLNPLVDLIELFVSLPIYHDNDDNARRSSNLARLELERRNVHSTIHALKHVFDALITQGRIHGKLKQQQQQQKQQHANPRGSIDAPSQSKRAKLGPLAASAPSSSSSKLADNVPQDEPESVKAVKQWLQDLYATFIDRTATVMIEHWDSNVRISALTAIMNLVRSESQFLTNLHPHKQAQFAAATWRHFVRAMLQPTQSSDAEDQSAPRIPDDVREEWIKYLTRYDDLRYYFLKEATSFMTEQTSSSKAASAYQVTAQRLVASNMIDYLSELATMPTVSSELNEWWCTKPVALRATTSSNGHKGKKRKLAAMALDAAQSQDGSTGVFDSSSSSSESEGESADLKLSAKKAKKLLPPLLQLSAHRRVFQYAVLALLTLPFAESDAKKLLSMLHRQILPHMVDPKRLMDWLVDCADAGGSIAILALNGLFTLITKHNLEYPDFYTRLYGLLDRDILHVRYRPRFFRLLLVFMSSTHLPAALVASFVKRLARLSLSAPPAAAVTIIPFVYNMLKAHSSCMGMIHRTNVDDGEDYPFLPSEPNPNNTQALSSSLWEIATLQRHYLASVSGLAKIFNEVMNKQSYSMEDFLDHSYATLFNSEATRIVKKAPALAPVPKRQPIADSFFPSAETASKYRVKQDKVEKASAENDEEELDEGPVDVVAALWSF
ncbi:Maturation and nuclear export of 40S ribosomal subunits interacting protein [Microbotryomycetes sp. JL221]|nr:Maturation and nuclear export of 40S ribosomal subunits interacting protein [Microbotryomycetes sp. JL221]